MAALRAVVRRPVSLLLALAANVAFTALLAWLSKAMLDTTIIGRAAVQFGYLAIDVTFGLWVMLLIATAFEPRRLSASETLTRLGWALGPAIAISLIDGSPTNLAEIFIGEARAQEPWLPLVLLGALSAHIVITIWIGCTVAYAAFVAFNRPLAIPAAFAESNALTAGSRWRLAGFSAAIIIADLVVSLLTPAHTTPAQAAISQAFYTCFWVASMILLAGMGLALTSAAVGRHRSLAAEFD